MWQDYAGIVPGIAATVMGFVTLMSREMPRWKKVVVLVLTVIAIGATWFNQSRQNQITATRQMHIEELKKFYVEANDLFRREVTLPKNTSPDEYKKISREVDAFSVRLENWVQTNMGDAAKAHLLRLPTSPPLQFSFVINQDHNSELNSLSWMKQSIDDLITNPVWDAHN